jgi:integrase
MLSSQEEDMDRRLQSGWVRPIGGTWYVTFYLPKPEGWGKKKAPTATKRLGRAKGPGKISEKQAKQLAWDLYLEPLNRGLIQPQSTLTLGTFWEQHYKPGMELRLKRTAREQYASLYKRWIAPHLGEKRLSQIQVGDVEFVMSMALHAGMSTCTAKHIRKVMSALFERARKLRIVSGDNPAVLADAPAIVPKRDKQALSASQVAQVLSMSPEPIRTMALCAVLTSANISELLGLRWKHINLSPEWTTFEAEPLPPYCMAIRQHFSRGEIGLLKTGMRKRNIPLPEPLVGGLLSLHAANANPNGSDDVVFRSRTGRPVNENNTRKRLFGKIAQALGLKRLGWHTFRYTHATLTQSVGMHSRDRQALMGHGALEMTQAYTMVDYERMRQGLGQIAGMIMPDLIQQRQMAVLDKPAPEILQ